MLCEIYVDWASMNQQVFKAVLLELRKIPAKDEFFPLPLLLCDKL